MYSDETQKEYGEWAEGLVVVVPWDIESAPKIREESKIREEIENFIKTANDLWEAPVNWISAMSYDAMKVFVKALKDTQKPSRSSISETIKNKGFRARGASGKIQFDNNGDRKEPMQLVELKRSSDGSFDFVPVQ